MPTLSEIQAAQSVALTEAFKRQENLSAAKAAALVSLYYRQRVEVEDPASVDAWLRIAIPHLIRTSDDSAKRAAAYFSAVRRVEVPGAPGYSPTAAIGMIDPGVRKSLMAVGPGDYMNKASVIRTLEVSPQQQKALLAEAKQVTSEKLAHAAVRHAQAGGRQTIHDNSQQDRVALGWVRVTREDPCYFCAMLAARGLHYRPYKEGAFDESNARFTGTGDAKVHDKCGCSLKPVYAEKDPLVDRTKEFADLWQRWGAGGGDAELRFRRGYDHWRETGEYLDWETANRGLRAA